MHESAVDYERKRSVAEVIKNMILEGNSYDQTSKIVPVSQEDFQKIKANLED